MNRCLGASLICLLTAQGAIADPLEDARVAHARGEFTTALRLLLPLAGGGDAWAQATLGWMNYLGQGTPTNYAEAIKWTRRAAAQGNGKAQSLLAHMYELGRGAPIDYEKAYVWSIINRGSSDSKLRLEVLKLRLSGDQLQRARDLAAQCEISNYKDCGEPPSTIVIKPGTIVIKMKKNNGVYVVPVRVNDAVVLDFVVDSGASHVMIPSDIFSSLTRKKAISNADIMGEGRSKLGDGRIIPSKAIRIRSLKVGDKTIANVAGAILPARSPLLLGQSFLGRFKSWSIDNATHTLVLKE